MIEILAIFSHENNLLSNIYMSKMIDAFSICCLKGSNIFLLLNFLLGWQLLLIFHSVWNNFCWFVLSLQILSYQVLEFHIEIRYVILYVFIEIFLFLAYLICLNYHLIFLTSFWLTSVRYVSFMYIKAFGVEYLVLIILVLCRLKF